MKIVVAGTGYAGYVMQVFEALEVFFGVYGFDGNEFRGKPLVFVGYCRCRGGDGTKAVFGNVYCFEIRFHTARGLFEKTVVEVAEGVQNIDAYVYVVVNAKGFEVVHAGGGAGNDELCAAVEVFEGLGSEGGVLIIGGT